jgi:endonuclease YncB( thermonuclease family)
MSQPNANRRLAVVVAVAAILAAPVAVFAQTSTDEDHPAAPQTAGAPPPAAQPAAPDQPAPPQTAEAPPEPVTLDHPTVVDTGKLASAGQTVPLFGVVGLPGQYAEDLHGAIVGDGDRVTCQPQSGSDYTCLLPDGTDVAALALRNGAAQTRDDAPDAYRDLETAARDERRGVWSSLPPPPVQVQHPMVVDTATLTGGGQTYLLDGVQGLGMPYSRDLQGYIAANGDSVMCNPQGDPGHFVCLLPDGTDVAKAALVNGAARVAADAPDSYRIEQGDALANRRGFWKYASPDVLAAVTSAPPGPPPYVLVAGDDSADGITYIGGAPTVMIDGALVFLAYGGALGWGYWDPGHHWHGAPARYAAHMDHYHPGGAGLRGSGGPTGAHSGTHTVAAAGAAPGHAPAGGFVHPGATPAAAHTAPAAAHAPTPAVHTPTPAAAHAPAPAAVHAPTPAAAHAPAPAAVHAPAPAPARAPAPAKSCGKPHC